MTRVILSWAFYWTGDLVSRGMDYWPWERCHPYRFYNWLMGVACTLQGDDPRGPWYPAEPNPPATPTS